MDPNCFLISSNCFFEKNFTPQLVSFFPNETTASFGVVETVEAVLGADVFPSVRYDPATTITKMTTVINVTIFRETPVNVLIVQHLHSGEPTIAASVKGYKS